jgi:hypothetical protein
MNSNKAAIAFRNNSRGKLYNCWFQSSQRTSILVTDRSFVDVRDCEFEGPHQFAIYLHNNSSARVENCRFVNLSGKGMFLLQECKASAFACTFEDCGGGIICAAKSTVYVRECRFSSIIGSCVHGMNNSEIQVSECSFQRCHGNGVHFAFSKGFLTQSTFSDFTFPPIAVFVTISNPVICGCRLTNCQTFGVVARDACSPVFHTLTLDHISSNAFSISQYSRAFIINCTLSEIASAFFSVFDGARPTIIGNRVRGDCCKTGFAILTSACPLLADNACFDCDGTRYDAIPDPNHTFMPGSPARRHESVVLQTSSSSASQDSDVTPLSPYPPVPVQPAIAVTELALLAAIPAGGCTHENGRCVTCKVQKTTCALSPCGHTVTCKDCAIPARCPICKCTPSSKAFVIANSRCAICTEAEANTLLLPCGHQCVCYADAMQIALDQGVCPICQQRIAVFRRQFPLSVPTNSLLPIETTPDGCRNMESQS